MKTYTQTITEYEQLDFDLVKENMNAETAIEILEQLPRGYFPYDMPCWKRNCSGWDYENYKVVCAIEYAIEILKCPNY